MITIYYVVKTLFIKKLISKTCYKSLLQNNNKPKSKYVFEYS